MFFKGVAENTARDIMNTADLNKDGKPDKQQVEAIAKDAGEAVAAVQAAVDWPVATEAFKLVNEGAVGLLAAASDEASQLQKAVATNDGALAFDAIMDAVKDPAIKASLGKMLIGAMQLSGAVDSAKFAVAAVEVKEVYAGINAYCHPQQQPKK